MTHITAKTLLTLAPRADNCVSTSQVLVGVSSWIPQEPRGKRLGYFEVIAMSRDDWDTLCNDHDLRDADFNPEDRTLSFADCTYQLLARGHSFTDLTKP